MQSNTGRQPKFCLFLFLFIVAFATTSFASSIEGFVHDNFRNALPDIDVELRDDDGRTRVREKTNAIGRYSFRGLPDGRYFVKVMPFRFSLEDMEKEQIVHTVSVLGSNLDQMFQLDFELMPKRGGLGDTTTGVVFAQEVPDKAKDYYKSAQKLFEDDKRDEGFALMIKAVETYPTYYEALNKLGMHLLFKKRYLDAASMFVRAAEVNPKSSKAFYYMGIAFSNLDKDYHKAAVAALTKAEELAPSTHLIPLALGKVQRQLGNFAEAEKSLIRAKKLVPEAIPEIHLLLAKIYAEDMKDYGRAADELEKFLKTSKRKDDALKAKVDEFRAKAAKKT